MQITINLKPEGLSALLDDIAGGKLGDKVALAPTELTPSAFKLLFELAQLEGCVTSIHADFAA